MARGSYKRGYKVTYIGRTAAMAMESAVKAHTYHVKTSRKFSDPEKLSNGQYRVVVM